jgi:cytochrome P450
MLAKWSDGSVHDMLVEMRRVALLIFIGTLFDVEFGPDMDRLWNPILRSIKYISPGLWIVWPDIPRPGYRKALHQMDEYLYGIIRARRDEPRGEGDLLGRLIRVPGLDDDLIRDQLLTMLIAGHDTSTALLAWILHLLGNHPEEMAKAQAEVDSVLGGVLPTAGKIGRLTHLDLIIKEALRLYPPIHVGNRIVAKDTVITGYELAAGSRTMVDLPGTRNGRQRSLTFHLVADRATASVLPLPRWRQKSSCPAFYSNSRWRI